MTSEIRLVSKDGNREYGLVERKVSRVLTGLAGEQVLGETLGSSAIVPVLENPNDKYLNVTLFDPAGEPLSPEVESAILAMTASRLSIKPVGTSIKRVVPIRISTDAVNPHKPKLNANVLVLGRV